MIDPITALMLIWFLVLAHGTTFVLTLYVASKRMRLRTAIASFTAIIVTNVTLCLFIAAA